MVFPLNLHFPMVFLWFSLPITWNPLLRRSQGVTQQLFERLGRQLRRRTAGRRRRRPGAAVGGAQDVVAVVVVPQAPAAHAWDGLLALRIGASRKPFGKI